MKCKTCKKNVPKRYVEAHKRYHINQAAKKFVKVMNKALEPVRNASDAFSKAGEAIAKAGEVMAKAFSHFQSEPTGEM